MDENTVHVHNSSVNSKVGLSGADRRWMDELCQSVQATWDGNDPWRPSDNGYYGSEDYIRVQFEEYIMHLLASVKYDVYLKRAADKPQLMAIRDVRGNPIKEYNMAWVDEWKLSNSYRIFNKFTDPDIFDVVEPRHVANPSAVTTITRQIDERLAQPARDGIKSGVSRMFVLWSGSKDEQPAEKSTIEKTNGNGESPLSPATSTRSSSTAKSGGSLPWSKTANDHDDASVASNASAKSGDTPSSAMARTGYFSGWGKWASERGRSVFSRGRSPGDTGTTTPPVQETDSPAPA